MKTVMIGLSGGVDSAVAAYLLKERGFTVIAGFMKNWSGDSGKSPCWIDERRDAMAVAALLKIPFVSFDFEKEYRESVVGYMIEEYKKGRTPNGDIVCNRTIKFDLFWEKAKEHGADFIATGHYARVREEQGRFHLLKGVDGNKDQSYFLSQLSEEQLSHTMFPLGEMTKEETREIARKIGLEIADKRSTRGICFVGKVSMPDFLREYISPKPGSIVLPTGEVLGVHDGLHNYTIGQRHGFDVAYSEPLFVVAKNVEKNELVVATENDSARFAAYADLAQVHIISGEVLEGAVDVALRYRATPVPAVLKKIDTGYRLEFLEPQKQVTPGQFAVFYRDDECLGSGVVL